MLNLMTSGMDSFGGNLILNPGDGRGEISLCGLITDGNTGSVRVEELHQIGASSVGTQTQDENLKPCEFVDAPIGPTELQFLKAGRR